MSAQCNEYDLEVKLFFIVSDIIVFFSTVGFRFVQISLPSSCALYNIQWVCSECIRTKRIYILHLGHLLSIQFK